MERGRGVGADPGPPRAPHEAHRAPLPWGTAAGRERLTDWAQNQRGQPQRHHDRADRKPGPGVGSREPGAGSREQSQSLSSTPSSSTST